MPLYEYHCDICQHDFEMMVPFSETDRLPECPICQSQKTRRRISRVAAPKLGGSEGGASSSGGCSSSGGRFT